MPEIKLPNLNDPEDRRRGMRAAGISLLVLSGILLLITYLSPKPPAPAAVAEAPVQPVFPAVELSARAAIVYDLVSGETLYQKNAQAQLPLASITKLLTIYAASDVIPPSAPVAISAQALAQDGDNGFTLGQTFAFSELARFALAASSNDAAEAIAEAADARQNTTSKELLAGAAESIGLAQTYAVNGTGLDASESTAGAYGSAKDVALLAGSLLQKAPGIASATLEPKVSLGSITAKNTNPEVSSISGILLSKTGYTDLAGGNLVVVYDAGLGHPIAVAVLGSTRDARFTDVDSLLSATSAYFSPQKP